MKKEKKINGYNKKKEVKETISAINVIDSVEQALENYRKLRDQNKRIELLKKIRGSCYE